MHVGPQRHQLPHRLRATSARSVMQRSPSALRCGRCGMRSERRASRWGGSCAATWLGPRRRMRQEGAHPPGPARHPSHTRPIPLATTPRRPSQGGQCSPGPHGHGPVFGGFRCIRTLARTGFTPSRIRRMRDDDAAGKPAGTRRGLPRVPLSSRHAAPHTPSPHPTHPLPTSRRPTIHPPVPAPRAPCGPAVSRQHTRLS